MLGTPILLTIFNRPHTTSQVLRAIRKVRPERLYIAADGPRLDRPHERQVCEQTREIATTVDWPCSIKTLFRVSNLGCRRAVAGAIDWFFKHEESGVILEDDCLPHPDFFRFAGELLDRYREDVRVMSVSGCNFLNRDILPEYSYYFSRRAHIWGWATWADRWHRYDHEFAEWPRLRDTGWLNEVGHGHWDFTRCWTHIFDEVYSGEVDSWAYIWLATTWMCNGFTAVSAANLVSNIGFAADAFHTRDVDHPISALPLEPLSMPLKHPPRVVENPQADRWEDLHVVRTRRVAAYQVLGRVPGAQSAWRAVKKMLSR